ncbi:MAG: AAA family ATPase [Opitutaceae bacterium]|nr:AAA family ATPase [Cytophagales bacterium]
MQKLIIKNFRQISYAEIDIKKFTIFIGPQASGKSTIAKLVYFFKSLKQDFLKLLIESEEKPSELHIEYIKSIEEKFKVYFGSSFELSEKFELKYFFSFEENLYIRLYRKVSLQVEFEKTYFSKIILETKMVSEKIKIFSQKKTKTESRVAYQFYDSIKEKFLKDLQTVSDKVFYDDRDPIFFPAGRNLTVAYPQHFLTLFFGELSSLIGELKTDNIESKSIDLLLIKEFISYSQFLSDQFVGSGFNDNNISDYNSQHIRTVIIDKTNKIIKGNYENKDGTERITFGSTRLDTVKLAHASSGQQESIRILQDIFFIMKGHKAFRIYEEPEAHLFPEAQKHLIELMALMANKTHSEVLITTHSPYILSIINNLLFYNQTIKRNPESAEYIKKRFGAENLDETQNERIYLSPDEVSVYSLGKDKVEQIIDPETGLIGANFLDQVAEEIYQDFDFMYPLNRKEEN